jgi:hypothetical protein
VGERQRRREGERGREREREGERGRESEREGERGEREVEGERVTYKIKFLFDHL